MEFNSQESCINAGEKVRAYWQYNDEALKPKAICVKNSVFTLHATGRLRH
jgi:hypothetical protein